MAAEELWPGLPQRLLLTWPLWRLLEDDLRSPHGWRNVHTLTPKPSCCHFWSGSEVDLLVRFGSSASPWCLWAWGQALREMFLRWNSRVDGRIPFSTQDRLGSIASSLQKWNQRLKPAFSVFWLLLGWYEDVCDNRMCDKTTHFHHLA